MIKVLVVFGTRPEAIKMCPLVLELKKHKDIECVVCLTGQHREMLDQVMTVFRVNADYNLDIMRANQSLTAVTTSVLEGMEVVLKNERPDIVLVHGDTTTSYATALAAFYQKIPVGHVEAGLRTGDIYSPFPEEMNRVLTDRIATFFFAPTSLNKSNLLYEGIKDNVYVTGNTVIDSFAYTVKRNFTFSENILNEIDFDHNRVVIVTAHRRENLGTPLKNICCAIKRIAEEYMDVRFVYPVHMNPAVRNVVFEELSNVKNVLLVDPVDVLDMHNLISRCYMVMTDSGGIQEEAPHFGKPVLVLRRETERPEAVDAGTVRVVGIEFESIYKNTKDLLNNKDNIFKSMSIATNPYGDGHASERIVSTIRELLF